CRRAPARPARRRGGAARAARALAAARAALHEWRPREIRGDGHVGGGGRRHGSCPRTMGPGAPLATVRGPGAACAPGPSPAERTGMVLIPSGEFQMGSRGDDPRVYDWERVHEQPQHPVFVSAFLIDRHEVTNAEYERFAPKHTRNTRYSPCDDCP